MSQEGPIDILGTFPQIPTEFVADIGSAIPILNILNIFGTTQAAGTSPLHTTGSGNTITIINQLTQAAAVSAANIAGLASFSSADFSVDANGFVTLGGTSSAVEAIAMQTGTSPVVATVGGLVTFNGAVVAAGTNPVRTDGTGPNTMALEVQISQAIASTNATNIGLAAFDSAAFDVDANGFVQLNGGGIAITSVNVDANTAPGTDPVLPTAAGQITITGAQVASGVVGTNVLRTNSIAANSFRVEIQRSTAVAATDVAQNGVSHYDSAIFTVDANAFVSLSGTAVGRTITGNSGGALPPTAGNWNIFGASVAAGTTPVATSGAVSTLTVNVQRTQAIASTNATNVGLAAFDSAAFDVDANGFVQLNGGGIAITSINVDANTPPGTDPVLPTAAGQVTITGGQVATGTIGANVIRTNSVAANAFTIEIQRSTAVAATDSTKNGVSHFDSNNFSVDANGFVQATGFAINYTNVTNAMSPYTVLSTDYYISVDCTGGAVTLRFPNAPTAKRQWIVKDRTGSAATNNISVTTVGGAVTFDGLTTYIINSNYQAINLLANATPTYEVY